jgi:hypothetical protein
VLSGTATAKCAACSTCLQQDQQEQMCSRSCPEYDEPVTRAKDQHCRVERRRTIDGCFWPDAGQKIRWYIWAQFKHHRQLIEATME